MKSSWFEKICRYGIWGGAGLNLLTPFLLFNNFYFPFTFPKVLIFRVAVEIMFLFYLFLLTLDYERYRPRITLSLVVFGVYVLYQFVAAFFGVNFYFSFWNNFERGIGLILFIHFLALLVIFSGFFKDKNKWLAVFDIAVAVSLLLDIFALGQKLNISFFVNTQGDRLSSTIGNGAFLAAYLLFSLFFCLYLAGERPQNKLKVYYYLHAVFDAYIIIETATRGAALALVASIILLAFLSITFFRKDLSAKLKKSIWVAGFVLAAITILLFAGKGTAWVRANPALSRITNYSFTQATIQTRFMAWRSGWEGWQERFLLGWGGDNFNIPFNKHFNPLFFEDESSRVWFDRAHNIILDQGATGGVIGLALYLVFIGYLIYFWFFRYQRKQGNAWPSLVFLVMIAAYLVQNFFTFDTFNSYLLLFSFVGYTAYHEKSIYDLKISKINCQIIAWIFLIAMVPIMYYANIAPALANFNVMAAMRAGNVGNFEQSHDLFLRALSYRTYGDNEIRLRFAEFMDGIISKKLANEDFMRRAAVAVSSELEKQINNEPLDVSNYLLAMRHYNYVGAFNPDNYLRALELFKKAILLSPRNPQLLIEAGITSTYLAQYYQLADPGLYIYNLNESRQYFKEAINLNPKPVEGHIGMLTSLMLEGNTAAAEKYLAHMDEIGSDYHKYTPLKKLGNLAVGYGRYQLANRFFEELLSLPKTPVKLALQDYINLALSYAYLGKDDQAIAVAEKVRGLYPENTANVDKFIEEVKSGIYRPNSKIQK